MRNGSFAAVGALWLSLAASAAPGNQIAGNPIANGDFEKEDGGFLAWWLPGRFTPLRLPNTATGSENLFMRVAWDSDSHGEGSGSLRFECSGAQLGGPRDGADAMLASPTNQTLVSGDVDCKLSWYWKGEGLTDQSNVQITVFCQSPGPTAAPPNGSRFLKQFSTTLMTDSQDWKQGTLTFRTPQDTGWIQFRISAQSDEPHKSFSASIDDLVLTTEPSPSAAGQIEAPQNWTARKSPVDPGDAGLPGFKFSEPSQPYGSRIQRTMRLLATSTPRRRNRVKILFYGQSIIGQNWWKRIVADLQARYPHADIDAVNPSIGGFTSKDLKDTMYGDCYSANADLICFHDYGAKPEEMEEMFRQMRERTTAEVMAFTHHYMAQKAWERGQTADSDLIKRLSTKHGFELVDIRPNWAAFLKQAHSKQAGAEAYELLRDGVHLNAAGEALWWKITMPHFTILADSDPYWRKRIQVYTADGRPFAADDRREYPDEGLPLTKPLKIEFEGTRVDVLADSLSGEKTGTAKILIDGKAPSSFPELYYATRGTPPPNFFQPMLRRAEIGRDPVPETWTLKFRGISETGEDFTYEATGSVTGPDGEGNARQKFVSNSGRLVIDPEWFIMQVLVKNISKGKPYPDGTTCRFEVRANFLDEWRPRTGMTDEKSDSSRRSGFGQVILAPQQAGSEDRYTLVSGLNNGRHTLEIIPNGDGALPLRAIIVHRPPQAADR
jgi:hypothetical protein